jgi:hypothetical protein
MARIIPQRNDVYFLAVTNIVLLVNFLFFFRVRCLKFYNLIYDGDLDVFKFILALGHEFFVLTVGLLSLIGIFFGNKSRFFFLCSALYISINIAVLFFAASFSVVYVVKLIMVISFLMLFIFEKIFTVYDDRYLRVSFVFWGTLSYVVFLYIRGII